MREVYEQWIWDDGPSINDDAMYFGRWENAECTWLRSWGIIHWRSRPERPLFEPSPPGPERQPFILSSLARQRRLSMES